MGADLAQSELSECFWRGYWPEIFRINKKQSWDIRMSLLKLLIPCCIGAHTWVCTGIDTKMYVGACSQSITIHWLSWSICLYTKAAHRKFMWQVALCLIAVQNLIHLMDWMVVTPWAQVNRSCIFILRSYFLPRPVFFFFLTDKNTLLGHVKVKRSLALQPMMHYTSCQMHWCSRKWITLVQPVLRTIMPLPPCSTGPQMRGKELFSRNLSRSKTALPFGMHPVGFCYCRKVEGT